METQLQQEHIFLPDADFLLTIRLTTHEPGNGSHGLYWKAQQQLSIIAPPSDMYGAAQPMPALSLSDMP